MKFILQNSTYFSACLRPHGFFQKQTLGTRFHLYFLLLYNFVSIALCGSMCIIIRSAEKKLESLLKFKSNQRVILIIIFSLIWQWITYKVHISSFQKRNFYTAATGLLHFAIMTILIAFTQLQLMAWKTWEVKMTTSIQVIVLVFKN